MDRHRESFLELIDNYIDIVFCNESEVLSLFKRDKLEKCGEIASICAGQIITQLGSRSDINLKELIK